MFGLGLPEVAVVGVVALLIFGPKKVPEVGSALGKTLRGFKEEMGRRGDAERRTVNFQLENVVPWGRSFHEYTKMFNLSNTAIQSCTYIQRCSLMGVYGS
ncbi:MAG: hypothetical protein BRC45_05560 [Cyanobacteria bacterium QS_5_48_63]|nr:MAG: hypothetical protein BRC45_05560 [Cyanobacteria bacterium QS_5_48_63]